MEEDYPEIFCIERFIPPDSFENIIHKFENGRTINDIKKINKQITAEEFMKQPPASNTEEVKKYLEEKEKHKNKSNHIIND